MNIISKYLMKHFIKSFILVFLCFFTIISILETMEIARRISSSYNDNNHSISYIYVVGLVFFKSITTISSFFPFASFMGSIVFYISLNTRMELISMRVLGIETKYILKNLVIIVLGLGIFYITAFDNLSAFSSKQIKKIESKIFNKNNDNKDDNENLVVTNSGLWLRDTNSKNNYIIYAKSFKLSSNTLENVRFFEFDKENNLKNSIYSKKAIISNHKEWIIENPVIINFEGSSESKNKIFIETSLSIKNIDRMTLNPKSMSFWDITKYIKTLDQIGLSTIRYKMQWFSQISSILQMIALLLLSTLFCLNYNNRNTKPYTIKIIGVILIAFPTHFINSLLIALGSNETISITSSTMILPLISSFILFMFVRNK